MLAHRHQGEYYAWQGNLKGAIDQLEIAAKAKDGDFYQASVVDTRIKTLRREVADQGKSAFGTQGFAASSIESRGLPLLTGSQAPPSP
jgi:hypothetical protein